MTTRRKPRENVEAITVRIPKELRARLDKECDERVVGPSVLVTKAISAYLDALPPLDGLGATDPGPPTMAAEIDKP